MILKLIISSQNSSDSIDKEEYTEYTWCLLYVFRAIMSEAEYIYTFYRVVAAHAKWSCDCFSSVRDNYISSLS